MCLYVNIISRCCGRYATVVQYSVNDMCDDIKSMRCFGIFQKLMVRRDEHFRLERSQAFEHVKCDCHRDISLHAFGFVFFVASLSV